MFFQASLHELYRIACEQYKMKCSHTPSESMQGKFLRNAKLKILSEINFTLGLGIKLCFILRYFPLAWSCHDFCLTSLISPKLRVLTLGSHYFTE
jgi:hypothetical protein